MISRGAVLALNLGIPLTFDPGRFLLHGAPLALKLEPQLAPGPGLQRGLQGDCVGSLFRDSLLL